MRNEAFYQCELADDVVVDIHIYKREAPSILARKALVACVLLVGIIGPMALL